MDDFSPQVPFHMSSPSKKGRFSRSACGLSLTTSRPSSSTFGMSCSVGHRRAMWVSGSTRQPVFPTAQVAELYCRGERTEVGDPERHAGADVRDPPAPAVATDGDAVYWECTMPALTGPPEA